MNDYDPEQVQIRPAATVMLVDDRPELKVLMMERHADTVFAGGMWVFPGGSVDADDDSEAYQDISIHRSDAEASELMGLPCSGLAYYIAAIRESFEEAGILLALDKATQQQIDLSDHAVAGRFEQHRDDVLSGRRDFLDIVHEENLLLDVGQMHYVARWITPLGSPRRFDARFFVMQMPSTQTPLHDNRETVHAEWYSPTDILSRVEDEKMVLMSPTLRMIRSLSAFTCAHDVIAAARQNQPDERARVTADRQIVMPGDPGYENGVEDIETGWIRLRPL